MYKLDKTKIYSVIDIIKGNFETDSDVSLKGFFTNDPESLNGDPAEFVAKAQFLKLENTTLCDYAFRASDGKWYKYFVPEDGVELYYDTSNTPNMSKDFITLRDFLRIFDSNMRSKRRIEVFVWDDKEYDGLISDIPEDFKHLDDEVVSFSTYIDDGFSECGERDYDKRTLTLEPVLTVFIEN